MLTYQSSLTLRVPDCDVCNRWRLSSIMTEMQEAADAHSAEFGAGRQQLLKHNIVWVIARLHLQMFRYPRLYETVNLESWTRPERHRLFPRFFRFTDEQENVIGQASTVWLLMDLQTRQSVSPGILSLRLPDNADAPELIPLQGGSFVLDAPETEIPSRAVFTDLDPNGHVNNTKYADWLYNALGMETMRTYAPEELTIRYNAEVRPDEPFTLKLKRDENRFELIGRHNDTNAFEITGTLKTF